MKAASAALKINATTIGRRLEALEAALGVELFERSRDGMRATSAFENILPYAEEIEAAASAVTLSAETHERLAEGVVRLTAPPGLADQFVAPALGQLFRRHPKIRIELESSIRYADLTRREADIALRVLRPTSGDLVALRVRSSPYAVVGASRRVSALSRRLEEHAALDTLRWIGADHALLHSPSAQWLSTHVSDAAIALRANSIVAQAAAAEAGIGVAVLPDAYANKRGLGLVRLPPQLLRECAPLPKESLWLVGHRALRNVPRVAAVWEFLRESFAGAPGLPCPR